MELEYKACPMPTERPCLMKNEFGEVFLVTDGNQRGKIFVTRIAPFDEDEMLTWESDIKKYEPLPKGTKVTITN